MVNILFPSIIINDINTKNTHACKQLFDLEQFVPISNNRIFCKNSSLYFY